MYILWKLVLFAVVGIGSSYGSVPENAKVYAEKLNQRSFLTRPDTISTDFQCENKPSGYYADPRYDCKVFHHCQEDGTKITIPCTLDTDLHRICIFREIAFNACEGSEIYLALPEDLLTKDSKETTASTVSNTTDFKLSSVLLEPSSSENNHSTTPITLDFEQSEKLFQSKRSDNILEVFNSVLREIQQDKDEVSYSPTHSKISPAIFSRGYRFQASSIRRDDPSHSLITKNTSKDKDTYLVEVYKKNKEKLTSNNDYKRKSKKRFFLPDTGKQTSETQHHRRKRMVIESLDVSRPYAVIYAKVPSATKVSNNKAEKSGSSQRQDLLEVPFAPAMVPADVPTIPITIETRRKKKSKSKKRPKNIPQTIILDDTLSLDSEHEHTSEQQNILFFAPDENSAAGSQNGRGRTTLNNAQRQRQNTHNSQLVGSTLGGNGGISQNNSPPNYQTATANQGTGSLQIPNFPFQSATFLANPGVPQYFFPSQNLNQPEVFRTFNLRDQFVSQPQQPRVQGPDSIQQVNTQQSQSARQQDTSSTQRGQRENNLTYRNRQTQNSQLQNSRQQENLPRQSARHPSNTPQNIRPPENNPQPNQHENNHNNLRNPEILTPQVFGQPEIVPQSFRRPENLLQAISQPGSIRSQTLNQPDNLRSQSADQPESLQSQTFRAPGNFEPQAVRLPVSINPQTIRDPASIQPQTIGQLQNIYLRNVPTFSFGNQQERPQQTLRRPQTEDLNPIRNAGTQNTPGDDSEKKKEDKDKGPQQNLPPPGFSGFDNPFFRDFSSFGPLTFNSPFHQSPPQSFDVISPHTIRYQEQFKPLQPVNDEGKLQEAISQPQDPNVPSRLINAERPQSFSQPQYENRIRQQSPETSQPFVNQPGTGVLYQPQLSPNLINAEREPQERPNPGYDNSGPQVPVIIRENRRPSRTRGITTAVTVSPTYPPTRQRNRNHSVQPTQENYNLPSTASVQDFRSLQQQNIRNSQRDSNTNQRQPLRQRNRQYYNDNNNGQTQSQYPTYRQTSTTPLPSLPPRQRPRRPDQYPSRENNQNNYRLPNKVSEAPSQDERQFYGYRSTPSPYERPRTRTSSVRDRPTESLPVTNMYFVTSTPQYYTPETHSRRPNRYSESQNERPANRPRAQIDRPPHEYVNAEPLREEYPKPRRYHSHRQLNPSIENDVNIVSTNEDPEIRHQTTSSGYERRPGSRGSSYRERPQDDVEIEHGFHPVSDKPTGYSHITRAPEYDYSHTLRDSIRDQSDNPEQKYQHASRTPEREYLYATSAPAQEYATRIPDREYSYNPRTRGREHSNPPSIPEKEYSYESQAPGKEYVHSTRIPNNEYRDAVKEKNRGNRYQNHYEEIPSTTSTTTARPTKKRRPPPPRPTFPPFPTFPPPPKRIVTSPEPLTEPPKSEKESYEISESVTEYSTTTAQPLRKQKLEDTYASEISEPRYVTENSVQTDAPELTTRRRSRKRRPRPRRPKTTTTNYNDEEDAIQVESITQATTHKELTTRSTPSNYNRWRQQTSIPRKTTTTTTSSPKLNTENSEKAEEYGSRINLFGRPRTRKPAVFTPRTPTTTLAPSYSNDNKRATKSSVTSRTRKPFVKKVRKKLTTTTTQTPDVTEPIARSDENDDFLNFNSDINLQELESGTQLSVENMDSYQTTEAYNDAPETTTEIVTANYQEDSTIDSKDKTEDFESTRSVLKKFQNRPRVLKFGKPRLKTNSSTDDDKN